jgi:hypothetical protein
MSKRRTAMKKVNVVLAAVFAMGFVAQGTAVAQPVKKAKDDLFAGTEVFEKNATDVTEITMDPDSLAMVNGKDKDKAHNTVLQTVRTYEYDKPGMYNMADVDKIRERLNTGDWHCSVHERHLKSGESTDICEKRRTDDLHESAIISVEPKELTFIHTISHRAMNIGMPGMGALSGLPGSLSSLATLDPEMLELHMQINSLKYGMGYGKSYGRGYGLGSNMMVIPNIDDKEIQKSIDKGMKDWDKGMKEWDKSGAKMKEFISPDGTHKMFIMPGAPEMPEMPAAPEPGAAPTAPELPPPPPAETALAPPAAPALPPVAPAPTVQLPQ